MPQFDALPAYRARAAAIHWPVIAQLLAAVLPAVAAVALGSPATGARWYFLSMGAFLLWHALARNRVRFVCLFAGSIPVAMMLRGFFYFNSINAILLAGLLLWFVYGWDEFRRLWRNRVFTAFFAACILYWWISYLRTESYNINFRAVELALSAAAIVLLGRYRSYLATALLGIALSTLAVGIGLSPYGDRLGAAEIGEDSLGNPMSFGLPAALTLLLLMAHNGRWLLAERRILLRTLLTMAMGACLLLSTSRGSWLVATVGVLAIVFLTRGSASQAWSLIALGAAAILVLASSRGEYVGEYFERAISSDRTAAQRTTGRSHQWSAAPAIVADSPLWGYGPGSGVATNIRFTGSPKAWHSLYLQAAVETGLGGLLLLAALFAALIGRGLRHLRTTGDVVPLTGTLGYMAIGVSVSGMDAISGVFLGLGFLALEFSGVYVLRHAVVAAPASCAS
jgi:O-antigen ligase